MRLTNGDRISLFNGSGMECDGTIQELKKSGILIQISNIREVNNELPFSLHLAVALPKGDRQKWLIEKCTEVGVTSIIPLISERSVVQPNEKTVSKLKRNVIESTKQCRRSHLMHINSPVDFKELVQSPSFDFRGPIT